MTSAASGRAVATAPVWRVRGRLVVPDRPLVMGIVNVTPDSFSDGGLFISPDAAVAHAARLIGEGADIIDIGGESTRPQGAIPVDAEEEARRVLPVIRRLREAHPDVLLSADTVKASVAAAALDAGADVINDVSGLRLDPEIGAACASAGAGLILMHSRGTVPEMATYMHAHYEDDVMEEVLRELEEAVGRARRQGVHEEAIAVDPGIGFSKTSDQSLSVLGALPRLVARGRPVAIGASRKRFVGEITGRARPDERVHGSIGAIIMALALGARIFRVHDVRASREALDVAWQIVLRQREDPGG